MTFKDYRMKHKPKDEQKKIPGNTETKFDDFYHSGFSSLYSQRLG